MTERPTRSGSSFAAKACPYDWVIIGYCLLMVALILTFGRPLSAYPSSIIFYSGVGVLAVLIVHLVDGSKNRWLMFIRVLYPGILFTFFYHQTGSTMFLYFDGFFDWQLVAIERAILGVSPTLFIDQHLLNVWLNELFSAGYFSYYLMIPGFLIPAFIFRKYDMIRRFNTAACIMFFLSYLLFSLYPIEGPRWYFADQYANAIEGPVFRPLVEFVIDEGAVHGGAMPSSHTGIAMVVMFFLLKYHRPYGKALAPIVFLLSIGTFWGRFHYVSDVIVGAAIAVFSTWIVFSRYDRWTKQPAPAELANRSAQHVA